MQNLLSASLSCIYITPSLVQKMYTNKIKMLKKSDLCLFTVSLTLEHLYGYIHIEAVTLNVPSPPIPSSVSVHMLSPLPSRVTVNEKMMRSVIRVISSCS